MGVNVADVKPCNAWALMNTTASMSGHCFQVFGLDRGVLHSVTWVALHEYKISARQLRDKPNELDASWFATGNAKNLPPNARKVTQTSLESYSGIENPHRLRVLPASVLTGLLGLTQKKS